MSSYLSLSKARQNRWLLVFEVCNSMSSSSSFLYYVPYAYIGTSISQQLSSAPCESLHWLSVALQVRTFVSAQMPLMPPATPLLPSARALPSAQLLWCPWLCLVPTSHVPRLTSSSHPSWTLRQGILALIFFEFRWCIRIYGLQTGCFAYSGCKNS